MPRSSQIETTFTCDYCRVVIRKIGSDAEIPDSWISLDLTTHEVVFDKEQCLFDWAARRIDSKKRWDALKDSLSRNY